jgi:voltage-gated potassium channel
MTESAEIERKKREGDYFSVIILKMLPRRLPIAFVLVSGVILLGTLGYMLVEGWNFLDSLYMTVITIATVGFKEVEPLSSQGKIFTILLIMIGMGILLFSISTFTAFLVEGDLNVMIRRRKMMKRISELTGHYIVCGIGKIGTHIIDELCKTGRHFVAIDRNETVCSALGDKKILYIKGDATHSSVLRAANIEHAKGIFCSLHNDAENLLLILTAKALNPKLRIIVRAEEDESDEKMRKAGADGVILTKFIGGLRMASEMIRPKAVTFLDEMLKGSDEVYRVEDITFDDKSKFIGLSLKESGLLNKKEITVVAIRKGNRYIFNPTQEEKIETGDALILIGETKNIREIKQSTG